MDRQYAKWLIGGVVWMVTMPDCQSVWWGFESPRHRKEKIKNYKNKTYENNETKTLVVYVSWEKLVLCFNQKKHARKIKIKTNEFYYVYALLAELVKAAAF